MHLDHTFLPYSSKIHSNIILLSTTRPSKWFLPFRFSVQIFSRIFHVSHACTWLQIIGNISVFCNNNMVGPLYFKDSMISIFTVYI